MNKILATLFAIQMTSTFGPYWVVLPFIFLVVWTLFDESVEEEIFDTLDGLADRVVNGAEYKGCDNYW